MKTTELSLLHFAPENFLRNTFKEMFKTYITADLAGTDVDLREDLTRLSLRNDSFDFIYASHVLEHIKDDMSALAEIKRVLKPGGVAILPVPIIGNQTIEYNQPNPHEEFHVRCPGFDYYDRYKNFFHEVRIFKSTDFDEKYQLFAYEDRTVKKEKMPLRPCVGGQKHLETVPVCFK